MDQVAAQKRSGAHAFRVQRGHDGRRAAAPVVSGQRDARQFEGIGEIQHILADGGLFSHAWGGRVAEARLSITAEVRNQHAIASLRQRRRHMVPGVRVVRKSVQEHHRKTARIALLFVRNVED